MPVACAAGTANEATGTSFAACATCPAGTSSLPGAELCTPCEAGTSSEPGSEMCSPCAMGTYYDPAEAEAGCTECPGTFTTMMMGAASKAACTCPAEKFWNRQDDVCVDCPAEAFCAGGLHLPVVYEGNYGVYVGSVENREVEEQQKLAGTFAPEAGLFSDMEVYTCASKSRCPGETLSFSMDEYTAAPASADRVRVGFPLPGACALTADPALAREGIACDRCQDGYYGAGAECNKCEGAAGGSIVLILICPLLMIGLYRGTTSTGTQRVRAAFILVSTCGMAAFFMQTIAVFSTFAVSWPEELNWLFKLSAIFMFDLQGLALSCFHGDGFAGKYWTTILVPFFIILSAGLGFAITNVAPVPALWQMKANQTFSMLGMLLSALYITLVKVRPGRVNEP